MTRLTKEKKSILTFRFENELCAPVLKYFKGRHFRLQDTEVPFYEYRMDVYGYSKKHKLTVAVELKLKRWDRAIQQALLYQLCSDLVYIAMPSTEIQRVDREQLESHGVGLISVYKGGRCHEVLAAKRSPVVRRHYRKDYVDYLNERG